MMNNLEMDNLIKLIRENELKIAEIQKLIDESKDMLKLELENRGVEELNTGSYKIRYKDVVSNRFDSKLFKKDNEEMYNKYLKESVSKRFTIQ